MKIDFDYQLASKWIESEPDSKKKFVYYTSISHLKDKRFRYFKRNKTNYRLDTNLTNLKSELRQFIIGDFLSIDLANSQPFILSLLMTKIYDLSINETNTKAIPLCCSILNIDLIKYFGLQTVKEVLKIRQNGSFSQNGELLKFKKSCAEGKFYDDFLKHLPDDNLNREKVKKMMFAILFSQNVIYKNFKVIKPYSKEKAQFAKVYSEIYKIVYVLKKKNHAKLAILLQRIEAHVFIDTICPKIVDLGIIPLTIHDSIIIQKKDAETALNVCKTVFSELFGAVPSFHIKPLKMA